MNSVDRRARDSSSGIRSANALGAVDIRWRGSGDVTALVLLAITVALIFASRWISPGLGSWDQAQAMLVLSTFVMIVAFGQQTVILSGGLDLSVGSVMTLGAVLMFSVIGGSSTALLWGVPLVLLITGCVGAVSGVCIALLRVPPFIMTLAMDLILRSTVLGMTGGAPRGTVSPVLTGLFTENWLGVPPIVYIVIGFVTVATLVQRRTAFGRRLYAVGTSRDAAYIAGLPVKRVTISCYIISSAAAGFAGILMVGFSHGATLSSGDNVLIPSIAAVVIGGTSILGGRGVYLGAVAGALLLTTFSTMITALGIDQGWRIIIYGVVILGALLALRIDRQLWGTPLLSALASPRPITPNKY